MAVIFPWPARHRRLQAIADATAEKNRSRAGAVRAAVIQQDIERMAAVNHFAESIRASLIQGHQGHRNGG
jgi:hypothetical protein